MLNLKTLVKHHHILVNQKCSKRNIYSIQSNLELIFRESFSPSLT